MTAPELYCFRCAEPMRRDSNGELGCAPGAMGLSKDVERALLERFATRVASSAVAPAAREAWYCPGCRSPLSAEMVCPRCEVSLHDLVFQLVELHPHR
ncbi:hypothetical protein AKJ09_11003 [Labilithrix luteola]|uniref:Uncharacterized protein n=1 Tax=Labilithrix luteola TaxID=1391654 RepID=A0A0K1QFZ4_9BACT|nr:hypothetical protein AKJ09_11003 [Labilithrix luteola]